MLNGIGKDSQDFSSDFERSDTFLNSSLQSEVLSVLDFRLQLTSLNIGCTRDSWSKLRSPLARLSVVPRCRQKNIFVVVISND